MPLLLLPAGECTVGEARSSERTRPAAIGRSESHSGGYELTVLFLWILVALAGIAFAGIFLRAFRHTHPARPRRPFANLIWALDLTYLNGEASLHTVLGLLDHGTRVCLCVERRGQPLSGRERARRDEKQERISTPCRVQMMKPRI